MSIKEDIEKIINKYEMTGSYIEGAKRHDYKHFDELAKSHVFAELETYINKVREEAVEDCIRQTRPMNRQVLYMNDISVFKDTNYATEMKQRGIYVKGYSRCIEDTDERINKYFSTLKDVSKEEK